MNPFEIARAPLDGIHLIEAGAGTGKTYTIAGLYLRLIVERGLPVDQILVVTYTKAATEELKSRIRRRLIDARAFLKAGGGDGDTLMQGILEGGVEPQAALRRIQDALTEFDQAALFTIHGFCQRVLHQFAFETGHLFEADLVQDVQPLIQEAADDFWRRYISRAPSEVIRFVLKQARGPEALAALSHTCRFPRVRVVPPARKPALSAIARWRRLAGRITAMWPRVRSEVCDLLMDEGLSAVKYGKCASDPDCPEMTLRRRSVLRLAAQMDRWDGSYPVFDRFDRFCRSCITKATKKKYVAPVHPFFETCDQALTCLDDLESQLAHYWRYLKVRWLNDLQGRLRLKKGRENVLFFDDLLLQVHSALYLGGRADLVRAVQKQYPAVLVDEFQDTDALQYEIFSAFFSNHPSLLFMIGDPKQAIYGFRGADLFSYLYAKEKAPERYTLTRNWRSTPALIQALNTVFGRHQLPFGVDQIPYEPAVAAVRDASSESAAFHLWYLARDEQEGPIRPLSQQEAVERIVAGVADRIAALLSDPQEPVSPEDIAVLTRTHQQAQKVKAALVKLQVPAVLHSAGSVFDSWEAEELERVLHAAAAPVDPRRVRTAMAGELIGASARELCDSVESPGEKWLSRWAVFEEYHRMWIRYGFFRMFSRMIAREQVRRRWLSLPDGERRLTNLLHLAELLHEASVTLHLGPEALVKWLAAQRRQGATVAEDQEKLRLESDAHAVRIITIHKSKGLQFDVVFCPFVWTPARVDDQLVTFHDPGEDGGLTLAVGPDIAPDHRKLALQEVLSENLRLMYVALTRAQRSCYMAWGAIKGAELSAPAYLLHGSADMSGSDDWLQALQTRMAGLSETEMVADLEALAKASKGAICVERPPLPAGKNYTVARRGRSGGTRREFQREIDRSWRIASFSSMTAGASPDESEQPDRDSARPGLEEDVPPTPDDLFGFPKGVRAGLFFHELLEHWTPGDGEDRHRQLVSAKLEAYGFSNDYATAVEGLLKRLARAPLPDGVGREPFSLARIAPDMRINEMEFYFPIRKIAPDDFKRVLPGKRDTGAQHLVSGHLERLAFAPMHGFLKGYIDMLFEHEGRFYLVDWKSNHLGNQWQDYKAPRLEAVMAESHYFLQSYLYALALHLLLRQRMKDYAYERHFGGIYYIFLRGIQANGSSGGIHYSVPKAETMKKLEALLPDER